MSSKGFISLPRAFLQDQNWKSLSLIEEKIFMTIYENCAWQSLDLDDHGVLIHLEPLQILTTYRELEALCNKPGCNKDKIDRTISRFCLIGFLRQEVRHRKSILTIVQKDIVEFIATRNATNLRQTCDIKEQYNNIEEEEEESLRVKKEQDALAIKKIVDEAHEKIRKDKDGNEYSWKKRLGVTLGNLDLYRQLLSNYDAKTIVEKCQDIFKVQRKAIANKKSDPVRSISGWLLKACEKKIINFEEI